MSRLREAVEASQNVEKNMENWTPAEKEICKSRYGCEIVIENGTYADVCTKDAPNDARIIQYFVDEKICYDLTRGSKTHLFDMYWDKFRHNLKDIAYGHGRINPKLWGYQAPQKKKRK